MSFDKGTRRRLGLALGFLGPNILGFLAFTLVPLGFSLVMALSNWDLTRHNRFKEEAVRFVGLDNFTRLLSEPQFWWFLGNTLFLMMAIPLSIAGSLGAAMLLSTNLRGRGRTFVWLIASSILACSAVMLALLGMGGTAMLVLLAGVACTLLLGGVTGGSTVYRTVFYTPHFVAGVPTFLLWKHMYSPHTGPINAALQPAIDTVESAVRMTPAGLTSVGGIVLAGLAMAGLLAFGLRQLIRLWRDGEIGDAALILPLVFMLLPVGTAMRAWPTVPAAMLGVTALMVLALMAAWVWRGGRPFRARRNEGIGAAAMLGLVLMVGQFVLAGLGIVAWRLPGMAEAGLSAPQWIHDYHWAKPSLMIVMLWAAIGSNNMLLYLAALTNVPQDLYEAADIDGASRFQRFWHVTWPQLAPTTFFIVVMSTIAGLQGGFEMARTMTEGGPAGSTTVLAYYIYVAGFETGRFGYASAIAWAMFAMIFILTLINWKFGNRYVND